jgi:hypothetical protein
VDGRFDDEVAAARACDKCAIECGLLDLLNFDSDPEAEALAECAPSLESGEPGELVGCQDGGAGRVPVDGGEAANEVACRDDAELDSDMVGDDAELPEMASASTASPAPQERSSGFRGVNWDKKHKKWKAKISVQAVARYLGIFADEEAAARAYDKAAIDSGLLNRLNFDDSAELPETASASSAPQRGSSRFLGECWGTALSKWIPQITVQGVKKFLGSFGNEEATARVCDKAAIECGRLDRLNFDDSADLPEKVVASPAPHTTRVQPISGSVLARNEQKMEYAIESARCAKAYISGT